MAIHFDRPPGLPSPGRYVFTDTTTGWSFVVSGPYGKCKVIARAAYLRERGSNFGRLTVTSQVIKSEPPI